MTNRLVETPENPDVIPTVKSFRALSSSFVFSRAYHLPAKSEWTCKECTYLNADVSNPTCSVCGTVNHFESSSRSSSDLSSFASHETPMTSQFFVEPGEKAMNFPIPTPIPPRPQIKKFSSRRMIDVAEEVSPSKPFSRKSPRMRSERSIECIEEEEDEIGRRLKEMEVEEQIYEVSDPPQNRRRASEPIFVAQRTEIELQPCPTDEVARASSAVVDRSKDIWECGMCTYINENPLHLVCGVCGYARDHKRPSSLPMQSCQSSYEEEHIRFAKQQRERQEAEDKRAVERHRWEELVMYQREILQDIRKAESTNKPATEHQLTIERNQSFGR